MVRHAYAFVASFAQTTTLSFTPDAPATTQNVPSIEALQVVWPHDCGSSRMPPFTSSASWGLDWPTPTFDPLKNIVLSIDAHSCACVPIAQWSVVDASIFESNVAA